MSAALKLTLPLLYSCLRWWLWLLLLLWALMIWAMDQSSLGFGVKFGGIVLWGMACALGANLRRSRAQAIVMVLPRFRRNALLAIGLLLIGPIILFATVDLWRLESVLALLVAATLGLGMGLSLPILWLPLAMFFVFLWVSVADQGFMQPWTVSWAPLIATAWLAVGVTKFAGKSAHRTSNSDRGSLRSWLAEHASVRARQPYRFGKMLNPLPHAISYVAIGLLLGFWQYWQNTPGPTGQSPLGPTPESFPLLAHQIAMFMCLGFTATLLDLSGPKLQQLRKLAVLPDWSRQRLFQHAEWSGWRGLVTYLLVLFIALLGLGLWTGELNVRLWLTTLVIIAAITSLGIYVALWLAREPSRLLRALALMVVYLPAAISTSVVLMDDDFARQIPVQSVAVLLAISVMIIYWLRRQARSAWRSISFMRTS